MRKKLLAFLTILAILDLILFMAAIATAANTKMSTFSNADYKFQFKYPSQWESDLNKQTNVSAKYGLSLLNYDHLKGKNTETQVYVLKNKQNKKLDDFLLSGKLKSKEYIARTKKTYNSLDMLLVGYEYDPPQWGIIKYEIEAMVKLSNDMFVYIQIAAMKAMDGDELSKIVENILSSFKKI